MRKIIILFLSVIITVLSGSCDSQPLPSGIETMGDILSRGIITDKVLNANSQALFNATGGLSLTNRVLTFDGTTWNNGEILLESNSSETTSLTAFYPAYNSDKEFITQHPYSDGALEDVLMAQCTFTNQSNIELTFSHQFSLLTFHLQTPLKESLQEISLTMPKVESIDALSGEIRISNESEHTTRLNKNETGDYSFIVPPGENCSLTITFTLAGNMVSHLLTHTFVKGHKYECNVNQAKPRPGIRTAADLIDFSRLINGDTPYQDKTLDDFREKTGQKYVYRLLSDITLSKEDCALLAPIGNYSSTAFNDTLDGGGHTITNLILPDANAQGNCGLFGNIGADGVVKNLHIDRASSVENPSCTKVGVIVANNYGIIDNCSVTNSNIKSKEYGYIGAISAFSYGVIINCYSMNDTIHATSHTAAGGIASGAEKRIFNCYSYNNTFVTSSGNKIGSIVGLSNENEVTLNIRNCYIYHTQSNTTDWYSAIGYSIYYSSIRNFYYNKGSLYGGSIGTKPQNDLQYDASFKVESKHISDLLNDWIDETGASSYKDYTFRRWTRADDGSACFE